MCVCVSVYFGNFQTYCDANVVAGPALRECRWDREEACGSRFKEINVYATL